MGEVDLSLVIPVFRNSASLPNLITRLNILNREVRHEFSMEFIFVDDGSDDPSWSVLADLINSLDSDARLFRLTRNFGQVNALLAGFENARGKNIAFISADLQDSPDLLKEMWALRKGGAKVVIAHRVQRDESLLRRIPSKLAYRTAQRTHPNMPQGGFDYALMAREVVENLLTLRGRHRFLQGDILWFGYPTAIVPYTREKREHGKSQWTLAKKWKYFIDLIIDGSYLPIQVMSRVGFSLSLSGLVYAVVITAVWLFGGTPFQGWAPIMISILFIGGLIISMLGIIGEYLWRIYDDLGNRPRYVVDETRENKT
jgi:dolichol-phosphate mannosyltransferase